MGAEQFDTYASGQDVREAFNQAVADAQWNYGHAGYTGTIAEKGSFVIISDEPRTLVEAEQFAYELMDEEDERIDDKWGPAGAIRVVDSVPMRSAIWERGERRIETHMVEYDGWLFF